MQELPIALILANSLTQVALGSIDADEYALCTFPERLRPDRCECRFDRLAVVAGCQQMLSERLQGMQSQLSPAVPLQHQPFVVPITEEIRRQFGYRVRPQFTDWPHSRLIEQTSGQRGPLTQVYGYSGAQAKSAAGSVYDVVARLTDPPKRRSEVGAGAPKMRIWPERLRHVCPEQWDSMESQERQETLCPKGQQHRKIHAMELKAFKQCEV
jgi:hypothetical protein